MPFDHPEPGIASEPADVIETDTETPRAVAQTPQTKRRAPDDDDTAFLLRRAQIADLRISELNEALDQERTARAAELHDAAHRVADLETHLKFMREDRDTMTKAFHEARLKSPGRIDGGFTERLLARTLWYAVPWAILVSSTLLALGFFLI